MRVMFRADPRSAAAALACSVVMAFLPSATLVVQRALVNRVSEAGTTAVGVGLVVAVVAFALFVVAEDAVDLILSTCTDNVRDRVEVLVSGALIEHVNDFHTLELFESPRLLDGLGLAKAGVAGFGRLCWAVFGVGARLVSLVPVVVLLWQVRPWIPVVIIVALVPVVWLTLRVPVRVWALKEQSAETARRRDHLQMVLTESSYAADVRLYRSAPALMRSWRSLAGQVTEPVAHLRARSMGLLVGVAVLSGAVMVLPIWWSAVHISSRGGVGTFVLVLSSIVMLRVVVWVLLANGKDLVESAAGVGRWQAFMQTTPSRRAEVADAPTLPVSPCGGATVETTGLRFTYPGAQQAVFEGLCLGFRAGTSTAIVGSNGAGKTTLTKLLIGLVDPDAGTIRWNGVDTAKVALGELRERIAVVPQNFSHFPLTIRENLLMGREGIPDERLLEVLRDVGLDHLAQQPCDLDVVLSKEVVGGTSLSGGQWQRLAIARAAVAADRAELFVWDEPTSALDPLVEFEVADKLLQLSRGRTSIVVSHRLGICTLVDRVIMLDHGQVVEDGTHEDLLRRNGEYARWFEVQGRLYRN
ncbi:hypothetical protein GCM10009872_55480 [Actinopolymorpha rutila]